MKPNWLTCFILALLALTSCESMFDKAFDKEADYKYKIENNTPDTVQVVVQANSNPGSVVIGSGRFDYTIASGATKEVWSTSGFTEDSMRDEEKDNQKLYWFKVIPATSMGVASRKFLNDTGWWVYRKEKNYKATYTLTLTDSDFWIEAAVDGLILCAAIRFDVATSASHAV